MVKGALASCCFDSVLGFQIRDIFKVVRVVTSLIILDDLVLGFLLTSKCFVDWYFVRFVTLGSDD